MQKSRTVIIECKIFYLLDHEFIKLNYVFKYVYIASFKIFFT